MSEVVPGVCADDPLEPSDGGDAHLPETPELLRLQQEFADRESAQASSERLAGDAAMVQLFAAENFNGPRTRRYTDRLLEKGWLSMLKMTETGEVFTKARQLGRPVPQHMVVTSWTLEDRFAITTDSVTAGMKVFRAHALERGGWRPEGGASLYTYFVGASLRSFGGVYIRWFREWMRGQSELDLADDERAALIPDQRTVDPALAAATRDQLERTLALIQDQQVREGIAWRALGYTQAEAAQRAGLTEKALERRLGRARTKIRQAQASWADDQEGGTAR